jgi:hypothetical protein
MTPAEIEAALREAFGDCEAIGLPLSAEQKQILLEKVLAVERSTGPEEMVLVNPLDELPPKQRKALLRFIDEQNRQNRSWKAQLLNDWLQGRDSGEIQVIRERYGVTWLDQIQSIHVAQYADEIGMSLQAGDRIEVSNALWEWVQDDGPCQREWFPCTVIQVHENSEIGETGNHSATCMIRFDNGMEYEIQGVYEWNRYNWRWQKENGASGGRE